MKHYSVAAEFIDCSRVLDCTNKIKFCSLSSIVLNNNFIIVPISFWFVEVQTIIIYYQLTYKTMIVINFVIFSPSALQFDDILHSIGEFGPRQRVIYIVCCAVVLIPSGIQFAGGFFFTGTPEFHCITPGVKCDLNKCCTNCTKYQFTTFTSAVTEVGMFTFPCLHVVFVCMLCSFTVQKGLTIGRFWLHRPVCSSI